MKLDRISYSKLLPTGVYANERIGLEAELNSGDDAEISMDILRNMVAQLHKKYNPQYYQPNDGYNVDGVPNIAVGEPLSVPIEITPKDKQLQNFIEAINTTTSLKALEIFRKLVERENNIQLTEAFQAKIKSFG